ncbi:MAG: hypothetical protein EZS28_013030 [Streblomastix strix]|uniref:Uncharacterized protein n=1 Tax=Streblomastix strix TaxID=222440 RepID=A0A5J4W9V6_9EUKA|nr:MAG: hypothetical protein EZS28_013030 [Streblomastix strix]
MNSPCQFNVSQSGSGKYSTIAEVLAEQCSETEGYEIALNDINHYEYLTVNQNASILIKDSAISSLY